MTFKSTCLTVWTVLKVAVFTIINVYTVIGIFLVLSVLGIYSKFSTPLRPYSAHTPDNAVLRISLNDVQFNEHSTYGGSSTALQSLFKNNRGSTFSFEEQLYALNKAATDKKIKGVVVQLNSVLINNAQAYELSEELLKIRKAGKPVYVFANGTLLNNNLLVLSAATERFVAPNSFVRPVRPIYGRNFEKGFYDKFDIDFIGQRMALYKDYLLANVKYQVDQDVKSSFDAEWNIYQSTMELVAKNYGLPVSDFVLDDNKLMSTFKSSGGNLALAFKNLGWYKHITTVQEFDQYVAKNLAANPKNKAVPNYFSINSYVLAQKQPLFEDASTRQKHIAYLTLTGDVVQSGYSNNVISYDNTVSYLKNIYYNANNVEALVIRIDSPGGSVFTGSTIRSLLGAIKAKGVPVVISQGFLAASSGYMISSGSNYIVSTPLTITGSIGVVISGANVSRLLENFKVRANTIGDSYIFGNNVFSIPFFVSGFANPYPELEREYFKAGITQNYYQFITDVYNGRKATGKFKSIEDVNRIAQGHEWGGNDAYKLGLVDGFGNVQTAISKARELILSGQKTRKTDKYSIGEFKTLTDKEVAQLPVVNYNATYNSSIDPSNYFIGNVFGFVDKLTNHGLSKFIQTINTDYLLPENNPNTYQSYFDVKALTSQKHQ